MGGPRATHRFQDATCASLLPLHEHAGRPFRGLHFKHAGSVMLALHWGDEGVDPVVAVTLNPLRQESGWIWHRQVPRAAPNSARYNASP